MDIEKIDTHEEQTVKALLDSGATEMFISKGLAQKEGYRSTFASEKCRWHQ